jgi:hypothetical protein
MTAPIYRVVADGNTTETQSQEIAAGIFVRAKNAVLSVNYGNGFQVIGTKSK